MSMDTADQEGGVAESTSTEDQEWGKMILAILVSVVAALAVHYFLVASISLHPTLHALIGVVLFFIAGIVMFKIVLF